MTQFDAPPSPPPQPQKTHVLAILSLVCALLICLPFIAPTFGVIFGFIALMRIARSHGRTKGKGMAVAGIAISIVVFSANVGLTVLIDNVLKEVGKVTLQDFDAFVQAVESRDFQTAQGYLDPNASPQVTEDQLVDLSNRLKHDYGPFKSVYIDYFNRAIGQGMTYQPSTLNLNWSQGFKPGTAQIAVIPIEMEFSAKTVYGTVQLDMMNDGAGNLVTHIIKFTLIGDDGPWTFPPPSEG